MLDLDWATIAFQIVNFLGFSAAMYYLLFRPVMSRVGARRLERTELMEQARTDRREAESLREKLEERLSEAEVEADEIVAEAQKRAEAERRRMLEEVEEEIEGMLADAREDVRKMRQQAVDEFHEELVDAVIGVSAQMVEKAAPPEVHEKLVQRLADRIWDMGQEEMDRVRTFRRSLGDRTPTAQVTTARPLSQEQQNELARTFAALADRHVDLQVNVDPDLGAGLRLRIGDILVDNSIAGQLEGLREQVSEAAKERLPPHE